MTNWNVVCRISDGDDYAAPSPHLIIPFDQDGRSTVAANRVFHTLAGNSLYPSRIVNDLLMLALAVYTADLRISRAFGMDRWCREITVHLPVFNPDLWRGVEPHLAETLGFLSGDNWHFEFRERTEPVGEDQADPPERQIDKVALFSGGLDSFVGAVDLLEGTEDIVALVGQYGAGSTHPSQEGTHAILNEAFPDRTIRMGFWVQPSSTEDRSGEDTMRSRSFLFLALGTAVAASSGDDVPLYVAENGLISLNVPLTPARMGSFSTRTTHPFFVDSFRTLLHTLGISTPLVLPYRFHTKGEMVRDTKNPDVTGKGLPLTLSCSRPDAGRFDKRPPGTHCGYCVPCIIRLASMKAAGISTKDAAYYDIVRGGAGPKTAKGRDRRAFELGITRTRSLSRLGLVGEVTAAGPLPDEDVSELADVYLRGIEEVADFLKIKRSR